MPVYAFQCKKCSRQFEISLSMKERENASITCPDCGADDCGQLFSGVNVCTKSTAKKCSAPTGCGCGCGCCRG